MRKLILILVASFCGITPLSTQAQIPENTDFVQTELNALFIVDEEQNQTTAFYNIGYMTASPDSITWIFPLPPGSISVEPLSSLMIPTLEQETRPIIGTPDPYRTCNLVVTDGVFHGALIPRREYVPSEDKSFNKVVSLDELTQIATEYQLAALEQYIKLDWSFAIASFSTSDEGLAIAQDNDQFYSPTIFISPTISFTYQGTEPVLPLAFHASDTSAEFDELSRENAYAVTAFIAANKPYIPQDEALVDLRFDDLRQMRMIDNIQYPTSSPLEYPGEFRLYYLRLEESANGVEAPQYNLESITNPQDVFANISNDDQAQWLQIITDKHYLSRLRTIISTDRSISAISRFQPDDTRNYFVYDTTKLIDPALFWGCTTEETEDFELESRLPSGRTYIDTLHSHVAHPVDWQLSVLEDSVRYAFAPQPVDRFDIQELELGRGEYPMLILERLEQRYEQDEQGYHVLPDRTWDWFMRSTTRFTQVPIRNAISVYFPTGISNLVYDPRLSEDSYSSITGYRAVLMAPPVDWLENQSTYDDMLRYLRTYSYFTSPELRHTLMLGELGDAVALGYPDEWHTRQDESLGRLIAPNEIDNPSYIRSYVPARPNHSVAYLRQTYAIQDEDWADGQVRAFEDVNNRSGYVMYADFGGSGIHVIEFSTPTTDYENHASQLQRMAESAIRFQ